MLSCLSLCLKSSIDSKNSSQIATSSDYKVQKLHGPKAPEIVNPSEVGVLEDLILSAVNEGIRQSQKTMQSELGKSLGGLKIPGFN